MFIPIDVEATEIVCTLRAPAHRDLFDIIEANMKTAFFGPGEACPNHAVTGPIIK
jgi:hypothetical protein